MASVKIEPSNKNPAGAIQSLQHKTQKQTGKSSIASAGLRVYHATTLLLAPCTFTKTVELESKIWYTPLRDVLLA